MILLIIKMNYRLKILWYHSALALLGLCGCKAKTAQPLEAMLQVPVVWEDGGVIGTRPSTNAQTGSAPVSGVLGQGTWYRLGLDGAVRDLLFAHKTQRLWAAMGGAAAHTGAGGLAVSDNYGQSWTLVHRAGECSSLALGDMGLVAVCDGALYTISEGLAIAKISGPQPTRGSLLAKLVAISPAEPQRLYVAAWSDQEQSRLFWSEDRGQTWSATTSIIMADDDGAPRQLSEVDERILALAVHPGNARFLVALLQHGVFVSSDGGQTLVKAGYLSERPHLPAFAARPIAKSAGPISFDEQYPDTIFVSRGDALQLSTDGGVSWTVRGAPRRGNGEAALLHGLATLPESKGALLGATSFGLLRSEDQGRQWHTVVESEPRQALSPAYSNRVKAEGAREARVLLAISSKSLLLFAGDQSGLRVMQAAAP